MPEAPHVVRFPGLLGLEGLVVGLRIEVRKVANGRGHRMSTFKSNGFAVCLKCEAQIEVFRLHPFVQLSPGLGYRGVALEESCSGKSPDTSIIRRVPSGRYT